MQKAVLGWFRAQDAGERWRRWRIQSHHHVIARWRYWFRTRVRTCLGRCRQHRLRQLLDGQRVHHPGQFVWRNTHYKIVLAILSSFTKICSNEAESDADTCHVIIMANFNNSTWRTATILKIFSSRLNSESPISMKFGKRTRIWLYRERPRDEKSTFCKSKMADRRHIKNYSTGWTVDIVIL